MITAQKSACRKCGKPLKKIRIGDTNRGSTQIPLECMLTGLPLSLSAQEAVILDSNKKL
jgi:hypothetical protein